MKRRTATHAELRDLKVPQERSDAEIEAKPAESAVWNGTQTNFYMSVQ